LFFFVIIENTKFFFGGKIDFGFEKSESSGELNERERRRKGLGNDPEDGFT
jgi:hypothetical protein